MTTNLAQHYLEEIPLQLRGHKRMAETAIAQLSDEDFFRTIDAESNSIAILVKHIAGNMRSRFTDFLTTDGEKPDRYRDREFEIQPEASRSQVMQEWEQQWENLFSTLGSLRPEDLLGTVTIRGEAHTIVQALNRALAHYAQHVGQIVFLAKHLRASDWKTLSIPRGRSEEYKLAVPKDIPSGPRP